MTVHLDTDVATPTTVGENVRERYSAASKEAEAALCCPIDYNPVYLKVLPEEILERDYGCGDPSKYCKEGDVVVEFPKGIFLESYWILILSTRIEIYRCKGPYHHEYLQAKISNSFRETCILRTR